MSKTYTTLNVSAKMISVAGAMHRQSVPSTLLASAEYFPERSLLELEFRDGALYHFFDVPVECFQQLLDAASKGAYFNRHIRNHFRYQLVAEIDHQN